MSIFPTRWGLAQWAQARWAFTSQINPPTGAATITGQGVMTANGIVFEFSSGNITGQGIFTTGPLAIFTGQGVFTVDSVVILLNSGNLTGQGSLYNFVACPRDMIVLKNNMLRSTVAVIMPVAFITQINMPNDKPLCSPTSTTIPATGSFSTFTEVSSDPQNNP